jgi:hypothetical protein
MMHRIVHLSVMLNAAHDLLENVQDSDLLVLPHPMNLQLLRCVDDLHEICNFVDDCVLEAQKEDV